MRRLIKSFFHAFRGLFFILRYEKNLQIHLAMAAIVIILAFISHLSLIEFSMLILAIFLVIIAELFNTVVELVIDYINPHFNQKARLIKDLSAGTVLVAALCSVIAGCLIFYPHIKNLLIK